MCYTRISNSKLGSLGGDFVKIKLGFQDIPDIYYTFLINDLAPYAPCLVTRQDGEISVETEGDVVKCMCVVAVCDKYRFGKEVEVNEVRSLGEKSKP